MKFQNENFIYSHQYGSTTSFSQLFTTSRNEKRAFFGPKSMFDVFSGSLRSLSRALNNHSTRSEFFLLLLLLMTTHFRSLSLSLSFARAGNHRSRHDTPARTYTDTSRPIHSPTRAPRHLSLHTATSNYANINIPPTDRVTVRLSQSVNHPSAVVSKHSSTPSRHSLSSHFKTLLNTMSSLSQQSFQNTPQHTNSSSAPAAPRTPPPPFQRSTPRPPVSPPATHLVTHILQQSFQNTPQHTRPPVRVCHTNQPPTKSKG